MEKVVSDKKKRVSSPPPQGIRLPPGLHDLMAGIAAILRPKMNIGEAYAEAAADWLRKQAAANPTLRAVIDQECSGNPELRALLSKKPSLLANRA